MSRKQERSQKAFSSAITLAAADYPRSFYEAGLAHVALLLPVLNFPCKRNLFHYGTSGVCLPSLPPGKKGPATPKKCAGLRPKRIVVSRLPTRSRWRARLLIGHQDRNFGGRMTREIDGLGKRNAGERVEKPKETENRF